jgi:hypothetical protein
MEQSDDEREETGRGRERVDDAGAEFCRRWAFACSAEGVEDELTVEGAVGVEAEAEREGKGKRAERAARLRV